MHSEIYKFKLEEKVDSQMRDRDEKKREIKIDGVGMNRRYGLNL